MNAAIYIRVSTERQAGKVSPVEQERDCRTYAESKGYKVVEVYKDIERYRVRGRLVEPSGSRSDRPELLRMISDAKNGLFEVVIAWKEDRLYRGLRPMLNVLEVMEDGYINIELVKESFDFKLAPIKASIAKIEIDNIRDRMNLGVKARLKQKKSWGGDKRYGYKRDGDLVAIHPEESKWVEQIFDWYISGVGVREIARRLIKENVPPKQGYTSQYKWQLSSIYRILNCEVYATGIHEVKRDGEVFELPVPIIIELDVFIKAQEILRNNRNDKSRNVRHHYLLRGLITCPCGSSWNAYTRTFNQKWKKKSTDETLFYPAKQSYYRCAKMTASVEKITHPDCPRTKGVVRLDDRVWEFISSLLEDQELLFAAANTKLAELEAKSGEARKRENILRRQLEEIFEQREIYIKKFGEDSVKGGPFTEKDLDTALDSLRKEEIVTKRELAELTLLTGKRAFDLGEFIESYILDIKAGLEWLDIKPENTEEKQAQFAERRLIVEALVDKVTLRRNAEPEITLRFDLSLVDDKVYSKAS